MNYSGGLSQYAHDQQERENESGLDLCEAWHHEQQNSALAEPAQPVAAKPIAPRIDAYQQPF